MELEKSIKKIMSFRELKENWNGYGAAPLSEKVINKALNLVKEFKPVPKIFPTPNNSITFEWGKENNDSEMEIYLELEIFEDKIEMFGNATSACSSIQIGEE